MTTRLTKTSSFLLVEAGKPVASEVRYEAVSGHAPIRDAHLQGGSSGLPGTPPCLCDGKEITFRTAPRVRARPLLCTPPNFSGGGLYSPQKTGRGRQDPATRGGY